MCLYCGEALGRYAFGEDHPFGPLRLPAFMAEAGKRGLLDRVCACTLVQADRAAIERFHSADSLAGDPITHLAYSVSAHRHAAARLCALAEELCGGRMLALGGGGYRLDNLSAAWCAALESMLETDAGL